MSKHSPQTWRHAGPLRRLPLSRFPQMGLSPEDLSELAMAAGRKGRTAQPMTPEARVANYQRQRPGSPLTPRQTKRHLQKLARHNRAAYRVMFPGSEAGR